MVTDVLLSLFDGSRADSAHRVALSALFLGLATYYRQGPGAPLNPTLLAFAGCCFFVSAAGTMLVEAERRRWFDRLASVGLLVVVLDWTLLVGSVFTG